MIVIGTTCETCIASALLLPTLIQCIGRKLMKEVTYRKPYSFTDFDRTGKHAAYIWAIATLTSSSGRIWYSMALSSFAILESLFSASSFVTISVQLTGRSHFLHWFMLACNHQ